MQTISVLCAAALAVAACTSSDAKEREATPAAQPAGKPVAATPAPKPVVATPAVKPVAATPAAKPVAAPPAGKPMRVDEPGLKKPFEVTIPDGFISEIVDESDGPPLVMLYGRNFNMRIMSPSDGIPTLDEAKAMYSRATVERAEKQPDGYVIVYRWGKTNEYLISVARPALDVTCEATVDGLAQVDVAVALCETIRP